MEITSRGKKVFLSTIFFGFILVLVSSLIEASIGVVFAVISHHKPYDPSPTPAATGASAGTPVKTTPVALGSPDPNSFYAGSPLPPPN